MAQAFDPYYKWLGIPPEEQPPDFYRLLALRQFEADADVIQSAADQRMAHLRTYQSGRYSAFSQKLLNEVANAKVCLLHPEKRAKYDQAIRSKQVKVAAGNLPPPVPSDAGLPPVQSSSTSVFDLGSLGVDEGPTGTSVLRTRTATASTRLESDRDSAPRKALVPILAGVGGFLLLLAAVVAAAKWFRSSDETPSTVAVRDGGNSSAPPVGPPSFIPTQSTSQPSTGPTEAELAELAKLFPASGSVATTSWIEHSPEAAKLVLHMNFESGTVVEQDGKMFVRDLSPAANHGVGAGLHTTSDGRFGPVLESEGGELRMARGLINKQPEYTILAWVQHSTDQEIWWLSEQGTSPIFGVASTPIATVRAWDATSTNPKKTTRFGGPADSGGQWDFVAIRRRLNADGSGSLNVSVNERTYVDPTFPEAVGDFETFDRLGGGRGIRIAEIMIFQRCLTASEARTIQARPRGSAPPATDTAQSPAVDAHTSAPILTDPPSGAVLANGSVPGGPEAEWRFKWQPVAGAESYRLWVQSSENLPPMIDESGIATPFYRVVPNNNAPQESLKGWNWKVRALVGGQWTDWSESRTFDLADSPKNKPLDPGINGDSTAVQMPIRSQGKHSVPDDATRKKASDDVQEVYHQRITEAKSSDAIVGIADDMVQKARESRESPGEQYGLLDRARALAIEAGDATTALQAIDAMAQDFDIDPLKAKSDALTALLNQPSQRSEQSQTLEDSVMQVMQALASADRNDTAIQLSALARDRIRKPADPQLMKRIVLAGKVLRDRQRELAAVDDARNALAAHPDDPAANLAMGRYLCFIKSNWEAGLPMLAKGSDGLLKELARLDQTHPSDAATRLKIADEWYERSDKESVGVKYSLLDRARNWYRQALPNLSGLDRMKAEKRIDLIGQTIGP